MTLIPLPTRLAEGQPSSEGDPRSGSRAGGGIIGRAPELARLREHIAQRHHTLVIGPAGIGKSALLRAAVEGWPDVLLAPRCSPLRSALVALADQLHARGRLDLPDLDSQYLDWSELKPRLAGLSADELLARLSPLLAGAVLLVDDFDGITPALARLLEPLFARCVVLGAITTVDLTPELAPFFWHFRWLMLEPLPIEDCQALLRSPADPPMVPDRALFEQHVLDTAGGNPLAILELVGQARRAPLKTPEDIRQLHHEAGIRYLDLTPVLLLIGAGAVVLRFLALGLNDIESYILAGSFGACFLAGRYFIYRAMRRSA